MSLFKIFLLTFSILLFFAAPSRADMIHLKEGRDVIGTILEEDPEALTVGVSGGKIRLRLEDVEWVIKGTPEEIQNKRRIAGFFQKAEQYFADRRYLEAAREYQKALLLEPDNADLLNNLGTCYALHGELGKAIGFYEKATQSKPDHEIAAANLSQAYLQKGMAQKAVESYQKLTARHPKESETYVGLGLAYYKSADYKSSITAYEKALSLGSGTADIYNNLASAYAMSDENEKAKESYAKALAMDPSHAHATANLNKINAGKTDDLIAAQSYDYQSTKNV